MLSRNCLVKFACSIKMYGALDQCRRSILINGNVMSLILFPMSISSMSHVDFKKWPCRPVEFKGQGPHV